jgi:hypothetical protein
VVAAAKRKKNKERYSSTNTAAGITSLPFFFARRIDKI